MKTSPVVAHVNMQFPDGTEHRIGVNGLTEHGARLQMLCTLAAPIFHETMTRGARDGVCDAALAETLRSSAVASYAVFRLLESALIESNGEKP